ncbi:MAG: hypothetical protein KDC88_12910 [Ignavibacteriae bacterium]|nr:hypothetical protein [Ignavibacteriota bacterium]MCB9206938.1 hypothetical protein [Ignavibacteriales bacterium]MCB9210448.1 hypothetical protein [Ignavibacteriales bacterium]MCB9219741.1 hypothetical protein [Ignavibacteriales bacterium]
MLRNFILFILISSLTFAQSESQVGWIAKFGAAGGFSPIIIFPNYDGINPKLTEFGMKEFSGPIYAWGGSGYAYVMIIDNLRLGGIGFSGLQSEKNNLNNFENEVVYSLGGGAATIEYTFPFVKNMALSAGIMIGGGSLEIDLYQNSGNFEWNSIWDSAVNSEEVNNKEISMNNNFFLLSPTLNLDFPITRFLAIRGGLGYQFTFGSDWEISNGKKLENVPSNLNGNGFFIQTGIFIGLFAF